MLGNTALLPNLHSCVVIGAILGFIEAIGAAEGFAGYLMHIGIGAFAGGLIGVVMVAMLPWAIGVVVVIGLN